MPTTKGKAYNSPPKSLYIPPNVRALEGAGSAIIGHMHNEHLRRKERAAIDAKRAK